MGRMDHLDDCVALRWAELRLQDDLEGLLLGADLPIDTTTAVRRLEKYSKEACKVSMIPSASQVSHICEEVEQTQGQAWQ